MSIQTDNFGLNSSQIAVVRALSASEDALSLPELRDASGLSMKDTFTATMLLVKKNVFEIIDSHDGIRFGFSSSEYAAGVFDSFHSVE